MLRQQYTAVGSAAKASLTAVVSALELLASQNSCEALRNLRQRQGAVFTRSAANLGKSIVVGGVNGEPSSSVSDYTVVQVGIQARPSRNVIPLKTAPCLSVRSRKISSFRNGQRDVNRRRDARQMEPEPRERHWLVLFQHRLMAETLLSLVFSLEIETA